MKPESPVVVEEILIHAGWRVQFKDDAVCVLDKPKDKKAPCICIPQQVGPPGVLAQEIMDKIMFDANLTEIDYIPLRAKVVGDAPQQRR